MGAQAGELQGSSFPNSFKLGPGRGRHTNVTSSIRRSRFTCLRDFEMWDFATEDCFMEYLS